LNLHFTDYPHYVPLEDYEKAISRMIEKLLGHPNIVSIYQIGSISNPGISDIDMLIVFKDDAECKMDPLEELSRSERYIFYHNLYGIEKRDFLNAQQLTFFHNYCLLWGERLSKDGNTLSPEEVQNLKTQTALEYLVKMYISTIVERTYGIVKIRALLLETKAMLFDLEFLNIDSGKLFDLVKTVVHWRDHWFEQKPDRKSLNKWHDTFSNELSESLRIMLQSKKFYLPEKADLHIARNIRLIPAKHLDHSHKGTILPSALGGILGRKYFNLQHRFNNFDVYIPTSNFLNCEIVKKRFDLLKKMKSYNDTYLDYFSSIGTSLNII